MVHDRIAAGETTVVSMAAALRCGKQMEKLPHYNFSWTVSLQKICEMLRLEISSRSRSLENSVWKRLWTCRETDKYLNLYLHQRLWEMYREARSNILTVNIVSLVGCLNICMSVITIQGVKKGVTAFKGVYYLLK
jgi:hypothetical protein